MGVQRKKEYPGGNKMCWTDICEGAKRPSSKKSGRWAQNVLGRHLPGSEATERRKKNGERANVMEGYLRASKATE